MTKLGHEENKSEVATNFIHVQYFLVKACLYTIELCSNVNKENKTCSFQPS